jgi:hypothetical protein
VEGPSKDRKKKRVYKNQKEKENENEPRKKKENGLPHTAAGGKSSSRRYPRRITVSDSY